MSWLSAIAEAIPLVGKLLSKVGFKKGKRFEPIKEPPPRPAPPPIKAPPARKP